MPDTLTDGNWSIADVDGPERLTAPIPNTEKKYIIEQDMVINVESFTALALNTPHPTFPLYKLVFETPTQPAGCGAVKWTRRYAMIPDSWSEPTGDISYNFIGIGPTVAVPISRIRQVLEVPMRTQRDYFLVGAGGAYATEAALVASQTIPQQTYYATLYPTAFVDQISSVLALLPTSPSAETYLGWVISGTEIAVDTSIFVRWEGNIWCRETRYVKAR